MTKCCCPCHEALSSRDYRALVWAALNGLPLAKVADQYGVTTTRARAIIAALCYQGNPALYQAHANKQATGTPLRVLRQHRAAFGFGDGV